MPKSQDRKIKLLCLMRLLEQKTDEAHPMTVVQMIDELKAIGVNAERKSIYRDIEDLRAFGLDVACRKSKTTEYFVAGRTFELPELKLLADAVASSKFITEKKSAQLIGKIESLASEPQARTIQRQVIVRGRVKTQNEKIYYNVDAIHQAIAEGRPVSFRYFEYCVDRDAPACWSKRFRHEGGSYAALPRALAWDSENYYMIAYYEKYGGFSNFRVDKMERVELMAEGAVVMPEGLEFDAAVYAREVFGMYGGREESVTLWFDDSLVGVVLDRFGKDAPIRPAEGGGFLITAALEISPPLFGWIFEFGDKARIVGPESVAEEFRRKARETAERYSQHE